MRSTVGGSVLADWPFLAATAYSSLSRQRSLRGITWVAKGCCPRAGGTGTQG